MAELSQKEWEELHQKTLSQDSHMRCSAALALGSAFQIIPDDYKDQAWKDLHSLTVDQDSYVRLGAADSLRSAFSNIPEEYKNQAWQDLIGLTSDQNGDVRQCATESLGSVFSTIPKEYRNLAWQDLIWLTADPDSQVRMYAYYSLGQASVFKATIAAEDKAFQENLENAIEFFERSSQEVEYDNPAEFCLPFYRSFLAVTFPEAESQELVNLYLAEAKDAVEDSKSRELLLEAVKNLSEALQEAHRSSGRKEAQVVLEACRLYCDRAAELLDKTEDTAPGASKIVRRGIPIFNRQIKAILKEIEAKAAKFCKAARDTPLEGPARDTLEHTRIIKDIKTQDQADQALGILLENVLGRCNLLPEDIREHECGQLREAETGSPLEQAMAISSAVGALATYAQDMKDNAERAQKFIENLMGQIVARLDEIDFHLLRLRQLSSCVATNSSETVVILKDLKGQLEKTATLGSRLKILQSNPDELDPSLKKRLQEKDQEISKIVEGLDKILKQMPELANKNDLSLKVEALEKELKEPIIWKLANRAGAVASIVGLILTALSMYRPPGM